MYSFLQTATTIGLALPIAAAVVCMANAATGRPLLGMDHNSALYAAGVILAASTFTIMFYTIHTQGPSMIAGTYLVLSALTLLRLMETMREYIPIGSPWGYKGG